MPVAPIPPSEMSRRMLRRQNRRLRDENKAMREQIARARSYLELMVGLLAANSILGLKDDE